MSTTTLPQLITKVVNDDGSRVWLYDENAVLIAKPAHAPDPDSANDWCVTLIGLSYRSTTISVDKHRLDELATMWCDLIAEAMAA